MSETKRSAVAEYVAGEIAWVRAEIPADDAAALALVEAAAQLVDDYAAGQLDSLAGRLESLRQLLPVYEGLLAARGKTAAQIAESTRLWRALILAIELAEP